MDDLANFYRNIERGMRAEGDFTGARIICAVSGGPDSVTLLRAMLDIAPKLGVTFVGACHFEHGIRGEESWRDMEFVAELCKRWGAALYVERADIPSVAKGRGIETAARDERRAFYFRAMEAMRADYCALGHHADDQAETVLMHMLRGSRGALGMRMLDGRLLRPLLHVTRTRIMEYLASLGIDYRTDVTNASPDNPRNALRLHVMPEISALYPGGSAALCRMARYAREDDDCLARMATQWLAANREGDALRLRGEPDAAIFRRALAAYAASLGASDIDSAMLERLVGLACAKTGARLFAKGLSLERSAESILPVVLADAPEAVPFCVSGVTEVPCMGWRFTSLEVEAAQTFGGSGDYTQYFDADAMPPAQVRTRKPGDSMRVFGASGGKPLKKLLIDHKVPRALRDTIPLLASGSDILWAVGVARGDCAKITKETKRVLRAEFSYTARMDEIENK